MNPYSFKLNHSRVHVWKVDLKEQPYNWDELKRVLSFQEIENSKRFKFEHHQHQFLITRAVLRYLLSQYMNMQPNLITIKNDDHGKPYIPDSGNFCFNVSHSGDRALVGITKGRNIGIDIEVIRNNFNFEELISLTLSDSEIEKLKNYSGNIQKNIFYRVWTRKEALLKGMGIGLSVPLTKIIVPLYKNGSMKVVSDLHYGQKWNLRDLSREPHYCAAVAVDGEENLEIQENTISCNELYTY